MKVDVNTVSLSRELISTLQPAHDTDLLQRYVGPRMADNERVVCGWITDRAKSKDGKGYWNFEPWDPRTKISPFERDLEEDELEDRSESFFSTGLFEQGTTITRNFKRGIKRAWQGTGIAVWGLLIDDVIEALLPPPGFPTVCTHLFLLA